MIGFPKPKTRKSERRERKNHDRLWIARIREQVVEREGNRCRNCQTSPTTSSFPVFLHMHEIIYRSKTRGRPIAERINMEICVLLCYQCHRDVHDHRLKIEIKDDQLGANGELVFHEVTR